MTDSRYAIPGEKGRITAVLGPTNTGKTHLAIERMLGHASGMIGFPLRLLARENYERICRVKGANKVALLTGEEKIIPRDPRYFVCTVESMPLDRRVAFLAIDEIQLCADPDRGHIFTDRLLHARGDLETMFLGAETIKPILRRLVPDAEFISRPRMSQLSYSGPKKLTRLPPRSAIVAFSAAEVYAMAELIRRQRGGAAVVLGALSPRTRNAQVEMYQAGEVDYLVATDAIGMGLNMDVDHVAFAAMRKFDGRQPRNLEAAEVAQIAGRAGRHMNDGTFGTTADSGIIEPEIVQAIEEHDFPALRSLFWRSSDLRFASLDALVHSLNRKPELPGLMRAREADDQLVLQALARDEDIRKVADRPGRVRLLWDVCQVPDFRKVMAENHARLLAQIYGHLTRHDERLPADWLDSQVKRLDRIDGDIDTIVQRIANIRTWTYISHRGDWVADTAHWQDRTRAIEDKLSDALHQRLTQRFVDRRTAALVKRLKDSDDLLSAVNRQGEVLVEGHFVGHLEGFQFAADKSESVSGKRAVIAAAQRALRSEIASRVKQVAAEPDEAFALSDEGYVLWRGAPVAKLGVGSELLKPALEPLPSDFLEPAARDTLRARLVDWLRDHLRAELAALFAAREADLTGAARGLAYQIAEHLGSMPRRAAAGQLAALNEAERKSLAKLGIRLGVESLFMPAMLKPTAQRLRGLLWSVHHGLPPGPALPAGRVSLRPETRLPKAFYEASGYRVLGGKLAVRADMLERFAAPLRKLAKDEDFAVPAELLPLIGANSEDLPAIMEGLGYRLRPNEDGVMFAAPQRSKPKPKQRSKSPAKRPQKVNADSPFAKLREMMNA